MKTKMLRSGGWLALWAVLLGAELPAIPGYGPFMPQDRVRSVLLVAGVPQGADADAGSLPIVWKVPAAEKQWATVTLDAKPGGEETELRLAIGKDGKPQAWPLGATGASVMVTGVYSACLNADAATDYVVTLSYMGCGLAADLTQVVFLLSDPKGGYRMIARDTYDWAPEDLVDLRDDGTVQWVETKLEQNEDTKGRARSFWVHTLWRISGVELVKERELARVRYWSDPTMDAASRR